MRKRILYLIIIFCALTSIGVKAQNTHWQGFTPWSSAYSVNDLYEDTATDRLYVAGLTITGIGYYDGSAFTSMGSTNFQSAVKRITKYNDTLYISVSGAGLGLLKWNGTDWDTTGVYTDGMVWALCVYNGELYAGGVFTTIGGINANCLAKYNGTSWSTVGNYSGGGVDAITPYNGDLYIGGTILDASGNAVCVQRWDGAYFHNVGVGFHGAFASVDALEVYNNMLYMGGSFSLSGGDFANYIAQWDGTILSPVGSGVTGLNNGNGQIHDLMVYNNELYAGGAFSYAGGIWAQAIAKWNGTNWCSFGDTLNSRIIALGQYNNELYIGGGWWIIGSDTLAGIAKWIGGNFVDSCTNLTGTNFPASNLPIATIYPNPASETATIHFSGISGDAIIRLYDGLGREVWNEKINGSQTVLTASEFPSGMYFYRLDQEGKTLVTGKLIIE